MHHHYIEIFLFIALILIIAKTAGWLSTRLGQPAVLGEILVGLLLGPTLVNIANLPIFPESRSQIVSFSEAHEKEVFEETSPNSNLSKDEPSSISATENYLSNKTNHKNTSTSKSAVHKSFLEEVIKVLAEIGVIFLMFIAGLETDIQLMRRVGRVAFWSAVGGVVGPMLLGLIGTAIILPTSGIYEAIYVGTVLCATSVSISAQTLKELKALKSKEGTTILGAAIIDDVIGIIILSLIIAFNPAKTHISEKFPKLYESITSWVASDASDVTRGIIGIFILIFCMCAFFIIFYILGMKYFKKILSWAESLPVSEPKLAFALGLGLIFAWAAEYIGAVAAITGSYFAGVLIGQTAHRHEITEKIGTVTYGFFVPIFFINIGLEADASELAGNMILFTIVIVIFAILGKVVGSLLGARLAGFNNIESLRVGVGMVSRGEVGLIIASLGLSAGIIDRDIFSAMVIMVLATTLATPILLRWAFSHTPFQKE